MPTFEVKVKWGKESYLVEANTDEEPQVFKAQLFALTGVPVERQKVVFAGKQLGDDSWGGLKLRKGMAVMLMGTADPLPSEPVKKAVFLEDLSPEELGGMNAVAMPSGLQNLGNTCYFNSVVQVLRSLADVESALTGKSWSESGEGKLGRALTRVLQELNKAGGEPVTPFQLINQLYHVFPDFGEKKEGSMVPMQQDAEECYSRLLSLLDRQTQPDGSSSRGSSSAIQSLLGGEMQVEYKCVEAEGDASTSVEPFFKLACHIKKETSFLSIGVAEGLQEHVTKNSEALGRPAVFEKRSRIRRLPKYLTVQLVRFYWKQGAGNKEGNRAKIVKPIEFPENLDVFEWCTEDLQKRLLPRRKAIEEHEDRKLGLGKDKKEDKEGGEARDDGPVAMIEDVPEEDDGKGKGKAPVQELQNDSGRYQLRAIITHQGYSADGGHYVAWAKDLESKAKEGEWFLFDDDKVTRVKWDVVKALAKSTGDGPIPYLLVYSPVEHDAPREGQAEGSAKNEDVVMTDA